MMDRYVKRAIKTKLMNMYINKCALCGCTVNEENSRVSIVNKNLKILVSNYILVCSKCGAVKGCRSIEEYREMLELREMADRLEELKPSKQQLKWLLKKKWFPYKKKKISFYFEEEHLKELIEEHLKNYKSN